jgi:predicted lipid-binding transport protein (Tim44 family)
MMMAKLAKLAIAAMTVLALGLAQAEARPGGGGSFGSRGGRTFVPPAPTRTAPRPAPIERSTQPYQPAPVGAPAGRGLFGGGLMGGLLGGLLGAGLFGILAGTGMGSIFWLILQIGIVVLLVRFAINLFARRAVPAGTAPLGRSALGGTAPGASGLGLGSGPSAGAAPSSPLTVTQADYAAFERLLGAVQTSFGREDVAALRRLCTPEMAGYLEEELAGNAREGVVNRVTDPKLLQGDLAEAWTEGGVDYASVAMRFSILDTMVERATGRVVSGDPTRPQEVTEVWTLRRERGGDWRLSAIQQA